MGYRAIQRANPALGHFTDLKSAIMEERDEARIGGDDETMYKTYRLNMGTPELSREEMIVDVDDWAACVVPVAPAREGPVCIGIDIGQNKSMTAAALYWPQSGRLEAYGAFPARPGLDIRGPPEQRRQPLRGDGKAGRAVDIPRFGDLRWRPSFGALPKRSRDSKSSKSLLINSGRSW